MSFIDIVITRRSRTSSSQGLPWPRLTLPERCRRNHLAVGICTEIWENVMIVSGGA